MMLVMLDLMTIRAKDDTFLDFSLDCISRQTTMNHISDIEILLTAAFVVKLQSAKVGKSTSFTSQFSLVVTQPVSKLISSFICTDTLATLAFKSSVYFTIYCSTYFEIFIRFFLEAILADFHGRMIKSGRQDSNLRPPGPKPGALPG